MPQTAEEFAGFNFGSILIPSFRFTFNLISMNHLDLGLGFSIDIHNQGYNDRAFNYTYHRWGKDNNETNLYPAVFLGFKIK